MAQNLMRMNSNNINEMDSINDYQKLFINDKIGIEKLSSRFKIIRSKIFTFRYGNIEDIWETLEKKYECYSYSNYKMQIITDEFVATISWQYESSHTGFSLVLASNTIQKTNTFIEDIKMTLSNFIVDDMVITYTILQNDNSGILNETFYQDTNDVNFNPAAVPFIEDVESYIENFLNATAPVLILQGEPGTGKTTFTKYILKTMQKKVSKKRDTFQVMYSFDESIFEMSDFYKRIIYDEYDILVLEDINQVLYKNQDEGILNPINKFLSVTDGLISKYKKIIITTNIESKTHIHPALLRPGRCYDVISFRELEGVEIDKLCDSCAQDLDLQIESINLSEFYAKANGSKNSKMMCSKIGF